MYFKFDEDWRLILHPENKADCHILEKYSEKLKQHGTAMIQVKVECPGGEEREYRAYLREEQGKDQGKDQERQRQQQGGEQMYSPYGYGPQSRMFVYPGFFPQGHYTEELPYGFPWYDTRGVGGGGQGGGGRGGSTGERGGNRGERGERGDGGSRGESNRGFRGDFGEYGERGASQENPRDPSNPDISRR